MLLLQVCCSEACKDGREAVASPSHCATVESGSSERSSPDEAVSKSAKCANPDTLQQKSSKELAKVKRREDKGIGEMLVILQPIACCSVYFVLKLYTHCVSKNVPLFMFWITRQKKLTDFINFWCKEFRENFTY